MIALFSVSPATSTFVRGNSSSRIFTENDALVASSGVIVISASLDKDDKDNDDFHSTIRAANNALAVTFESTTGRKPGGNDDELLVVGGFAIIVVVIVMEHGGVASKPKTGCLFPVTSLGHLPMRASIIIIIVIIIIIIIYRVCLISNIF
jgi:hypothetical protein